MLERLDYVKLAPRCILDAGSGPGRDARALMHAMQAARSSRSISHCRCCPGHACSSACVGVRPGGVRGLAQLPLPENDRPCVVEHGAALAERAARGIPGIPARARTRGLLMFSTLGPDTLKELRAAAASGACTPPSTCTTSATSGRRRISAPVMDMELLSLTYPDPSGLLADLRASGQTCARPTGRAGLRASASVRVCARRSGPTPRSNGLRPRLESRARAARKSNSASFQAYS